MDSSAEEFKSSPTGCNFCDNYFKNESKVLIGGAAGQKILKQLFSTVKYRTRNKKYNAIAGISGGIDSSFAIYQAYKYGLKLKLVHLDNGWNTEIANDNIKALANYTGYDLEFVTPPVKEFQALQIAYLKAGVINIEVPTDLSLKAVNYRLALKEKIPYLIQGNNFVSEGLGVGSWGYANDDLANLKDIFKKHGIGTIDHLPLLNKLQYEYYRSKVHRITPLNYIDYDPLAARKELEKKVPCWKDYGGKHHESLWTKFYQNFILPKKFFVDKRKMHLSSLICAGILSLEEALKELAKPLYPREELHRDLLDIASIFDLSIPGLLELIFNSPERSHTHYKTDKHLRKVTPYMVLLLQPKKLARKIFGR